MRHSPILLLALLLQSVQAIGQLYNTSFGEFREADMREILEMKFYPPDSGADAVILYEKCEIEMTNQHTRITQLRRVKIFKNSAIERWSNMVKRVDDHGVTQVRGNCYTFVDGTLQKRALTEENIYKSDVRPGIDSYAAAMPNVVPGSVVEFEFDTNLTQYYTYADWVFQNSVPTVMSEFFVTGKVRFNSDVSGMQKPEYSYDRLRGVHHWWLANSSAFHPEIMMPHISLYRASLNTFYESIHWSDQVPKIWKAGGIGLLINGKPSWKRKAEDIVTGIADPKEKVKAIVNYVKEAMSWDGVDGIESLELERSLDRKRGSAPDLNIYMISLIRKAGIEVNPVLIQPREYGPYHEHFSTLEQFGYIIGQVTIGTDTIYVDATDRTLPYDVLPYRCLNERGLTLLKNDAKWVSIKPSVRNRVTIESTMAIDQHGVLSGNVLKKAEGYTGHAWRKSLIQDSKKFTDSMANVDWTVSKSSHTDFNKVEQPVMINYDVATNMQANVSGGYMYVTPFTLPDTTDLFKAEKRLYPMDFVVPQEQVLIFNLKVPDGYEVDQLPESKVMSIPGNTAKAFFNFSKVGQQVQILTRVMVTRTYFEAEEYAALKDLHQRIEAKQKEPIVLKKR